MTTPSRVIQNTGGVRVVYQSGCKRSIRKGADNVGRSSLIKLLQGPSVSGGKKSIHLAVGALPLRVPGDPFKLRLRTQLEA